MRVAPPLSLLVVVMAVAPVRADFTFSEGAFTTAARVSTNTNTPFPPGPTYSLVTTPTTSYGESSLIASSDGRSTGYFSDSALKFALGAVIPPGQSIIAATLSLTVKMSQITVINSPSLGVYGFTANANAVALSDFSLSSTLVGQTTQLGNTGYTSVLPPFTFDVTSFLRSLGSSGATSAGFRLETLTGGNLNFANSDDPTQAYRPTLTITYAAAVPEPASAALTVLGVAIAWAAARRGSQSA